MTEKFSPKRAKTQPEQIKAAQDGLINDGPKITGHMPDKIREIMEKQAQGMAQNTVPDMNIPLGKRTTTGNENLDAMLRHIKTTTEQYRTVELPSRGKFYNGHDGPTNGVLHLRPMTGHEQEIFANGRDKRMDPMSKVFSQCIQEGYDTQSFLSVDREWLAIMLRGICLGKDFECTITCPVSYCNRSYNHVVDLDEDIFVRYCPDDFGPANLHDKFPICGYNFTYRYPTLLDTENVAKERERKISTFGSDALNSNSIDLSSVLANYVVSIEGPLGILDNRMDISFMIKNLHWNDNQYLQERIENPPFGQDPNIMISCPYCGEESSVKLPVNQGFFSLRLKKESNSLE